MKTDKFGNPRDPKFAYATFVQGKLWGSLPKWMTWRKFQERFRRRKRLRKLADAARRINARHKGRTKCRGKG